MKIIVIVSDTFRWDFLSCYGNSWIRTPNLDRFAKRSIVFNRAYVGSFPTAPQRHDLFTGRYCLHTTGWAPLDPKDENFPKLLREHGYYTSLITDTILGIWEQKNFFKVFNDWEFIDRSARSLPEPEKGVKTPCSLDKFRFPEEANLYPRLVARKESEHFCARTMLKAAEWLEKNGNTYHEFLLYADTWDPHEPWVPPDEYVDLYDPVYEGEFVFSPRYDYSDYLNEAELKHMRALYAGMVTLVDKWVGFLLDRIEDLGLFEEAAVIFSSDHGFYHGERGRVGKHAVLNPKDGWPLYEEVSHIPLMMSIPGMPGGIRCDTLIQPVDIMGTILDIAGMRIPKDLHGQSVLPVLEGEKDGIREVAVSSGGPYFQPNVARPPPHIKHQFVLSPDPEYVSHSTITEGEWTMLYATEGVHAELYNLRTDPKQEHNVISDNREIAKKSQRRFYHFLENIGATEEILKIRKGL